LGPDTAIHVSAEEYEALLRLGPEYLELEIVVSENGRVDAVKVVGDDHFHHGEEALVIERARVFKPWMQDGAKVRVKGARLRESVAAGAVGSGAGSVSGAVGPRWSEGEAYAHWVPRLVSRV
jgi:hypothetical protein